MQLTEQQIKSGWQIVKFGNIAREVKASTKNPAEDGVWCIYSSGKTDG